MKTIQMEIDESLLVEVDRVSRALKTTRSAFICDVLRLVLRQPTIAELEQQHIQGYMKHPVLAGEFDGWETEQAWGNE